MSAWEASSDADPVYSLLHKIEKCSASLTHRNNEHFGNVGTEIRKLETQLAHEREIHKRKDILNSIREWRKREEILWWQRARSDYLKYGDSYTRWFHSRASIRRARNHIKALTDDEGVQQTEQGGITQTIVNYFSDLFSASPQCDMDAVLNTVPTRVTTDMNAKLCMAYT